MEKQVSSEKMSLEAPALGGHSNVSEQVAQAEDTLACRRDIAELEAQDDAMQLLASEEPGPLKEPSEAAIADSLHTLPAIQRRRARAKLISTLARTLQRVLQHA